LTVAGESFPLSDRVDLQRALDAYQQVPERRIALHGVAARYSQSPSLSENFDQLELVPIRLTSAPVPNNNVVMCIARGLAIVSDAARPAVLLIETDTDAAKLEVMTRTLEDAQAVIAELKRTMREHSIYRGRAVTLEASWRRHGQLRFIDVPQVRRGDIVLPG